MSGYNFAVLLLTKDAFLYLHNHHPLWFLYTSAYTSIRLQFDSIQHISLAKRYNAQKDRCIHVDVLPLQESLERGHDSSLP